MKTQLVTRSTTVLLAFAITALAFVMLVFGVFNITFMLKVIEWSPGIQYFQVVGGICLIATIIGVCVPGGWGRWWFTIIFAFATVHFFSGSAQTEYLARPEVLFAFHISFFGFSAAHLAAKAKHLLG